MATNTVAEWLDSRLQVQIEAALAKAMPKQPESKDPVKFNRNDIYQAAQDGRVIDQSGKPVDSAEFHQGTASGVDSLRVMGLPIGSMVVGGLTGMTVNAVVDRLPMLA